MRPAPYCMYSVLLLCLLGSFWPARESWGQAAVERIGTVLVVEGTAVARAQGATAWEPLHFRDAILPQDTVRTEVGSKVKVLLRDDSIMTLAEHSELQFSEFLLAPQQRRTIVTLAVGTVRVITERLFGTGSVTEVRTANTVIGVRGTTFVVRFTPPDTTEVLSLEGVVSVRNLAPGTPEVLPVPAHFQTRVQGNSPPARAIEIAPDTMRQLVREVRLIEQIPGEVLPSEKIPPPMPARDGGQGAAAGAPGTPNGVNVPPPPPGANPALGPLAPPPPPPPPPPTPPAVLQAQPAPERGVVPPARVITPDTAMKAARTNANLLAFPPEASPGPGAPGSGPASTGGTIGSGPGGSSSHPGSGPALTPGTPLPSALP